MRQLCVIGPLSNACDYVYHLQAKARGTGVLSFPQLQLVAQHLCSYHRTWAQQCELGIRQHFISFFNFWSTLRGSKLLRPLVCHEIVMMLEYDLVVVHVSLQAAQKENISFIGPLQ